MSKKVKRVLGDGAKGDVDTDLDTPAEPDTKAPAKTEAKESKK